MLNCNLNAICPSYVPWAYPVTREGHISSHLVFPEKKQAKWTTQGSNLRDEKRTAGLLHKTNFLLIQHCHHCDHSEDFLWSCIAITAIILLISSSHRCDHCPPGQPLIILNTEKVMWHIIWKLFWSPWPLTNQLDQSAWQISPTNQLDQSARPISLTNSHCPISFNTHPDQSARPFSNQPNQSA